MTTKKALTGMRGFSYICAGQIVSLIGTAMTQFAISIWAYKMTGKATVLAIVGFFTFFPTVFVSPIAAVSDWGWFTALYALLFIIVLFPICPLLKLFYLILSHLYSQWGLKERIVGFLNS